jgi:hypothetical protein
MNNLIKNNSIIPDNKIIDKTFDKLTIFGSAQLLVPKQMSYIDKKGNKKIINTVTKTKNFTKREGIQSVKILFHDDDRAYINIPYRTSGRTMNDIKKGTNIEIKGGISDFYKKKYMKLIFDYSAIYKKQVDNYDKKRENQLKNMYENIMNIYNKDKLDVPANVMSIIDTTYMSADGAFNRMKYYINNPNQSLKSYSSKSTISPPEVTMSKRRR